MKGKFASFKLAGQPTPPVSPWILGSNQINGYGTFCDGLSYSKTIACNVGDILSFSEGCASMGGGGAVFGCVNLPIIGIRRWGGQNVILSCTLSTSGTTFFWNGVFKINGVVVTP